MVRKSLVLSLGVASALSLLLLGCQPAQPAATPKAAEKAGATATKPAEKGAAATPAKAVEKPLRGGTVRVAATTLPDSLDAHLTTLQFPIGLLYDALIQQTKDQDPTKDGQVQDWSIGADGKSFTLQLRKGIKFHDGTDLDAAAIKFNVERMLDPATKSPYRTNWDTTASVEVVDSSTIRFNLKQIDPLFLPRLVQVSAMMVSPAAVKKFGQDFGRNPVGTGPFQFMEWVPGDHITLKRFEGYWQKDKSGNQLPFLDQVVLKDVPDPTTGVASLRTAQVDMFPMFPEAQLSLLKSDTNLTYQRQLATFFTSLCLNNKKPPFDNKALRQAAALAVDREGIASVYGEGALVQTSLFLPSNRGVWDADGKAGVFPARDLAKAKAKMAEGGYPSGGLNVKYSSGNAPDAVKMAEVVKSNLAEIGVGVEIEVLASAALTTKVRVQQDYQLASCSSGVGLGDPGHTFSIAYTSKGSRNYSGPYGNPKVDELIGKAGTTYDQKERAALYQQAAGMIVDEVALVPLYLSNYLHGMSKKVRDFIPISNPLNLESFRQVWLAQ